MINSLYDSFKHWSAKGSVWIISDTHFDDEDTMLMDSDWISPQEQVDILNKYCFKNDTLVILGDVGNPAWLDKVKCKNRVLVMGNHDQSRKKYEPYFSEIYEGALFIGSKILLSHEPIKGLKFCLNICGHKHDWKTVYADVFGCVHINVAANVQNYKPINLGRIIKSGWLSDIKDIHRLTIDDAISRKKCRE